MEPFLGINRGKGFFGLCCGKGLKGRGGGRGGELRNLANGR